MRRRRVIAVIVCVAAAAAAAAWWLRPRTLEYPGANVLLVTLDTLRADRLGSYGHGAARTPVLDRLAGDGIRFAEVVAPVPLTLPSHTTLMASQRPPRHGVRDNAGFEVAGDATLLADLLSTQGYDTGAFVGAYVLHARWGLDRGFDVYDDDFDYGAPDSTPGQVERRGDRVVEAALPWLERERDRPFFAWVHLYDPHAPYAAPEPFASRVADPYDAEVAFTDSLVGRLLEALEESGASDDTLVVVTADHGEGLDDHDEPGHGLFVYDTTLLVPLLIRLPDRRQAGRVVDDQVRLLDVAPTLLALLGVEPHPSFEGLDLRATLEEGYEPPPAYSESFFPRLHFGWQELYAVRHGGFKYILAPRPELYDLAEDAAESVNLADRRQAKAQQLATLLEELRGDPAAVEPGRVDPEVEERLRALGYIGSAPATTASDGPLPDPKDKLPLFRRLTSAQGALQAGNPAAAEAMLEEIVAQDADIVDAWFTLGNARFAQGDHAGAADAFHATLQLNPGYDLALANLGLARRRMGDLEAARADFEALLEISPDHANAHFHLGEMELEAGDPAAAREHFRSGLEANDGMAGLRFGLGVALFQLGDLERATRELQRVEATAPSYPRLRYYLALVAERRGDLAAAERHYRAEVELRPDNARAWFNLSQIFAARGDHAEAVEALRAATEARPELAVAHLYLGRSLVALNDPAALDEAEAAARRALQLGLPEGQRPMGHLVLADVYNRQGRTDEAQRELARAREAGFRPGQR